MRRNLLIYGIHKLPNLKLRDIKDNLNSVDSSEGNQGRILCQICPAKDSALYPKQVSRFGKRRTIFYCATCGKERRIRNAEKNKLLVLINRRLLKEYLDQRRRNG